VKPAYRLKDIQRNLARAQHRLDRVPGNQHRVLYNITYSCVDIQQQQGEFYPHQLKLSDVDMLIGKYGADTLLNDILTMANRVAPKNTNEVSGATKTGDITHGGNSNSGEVEHQAECRVENNRKNSKDDNNHQGGNQIVQPETDSNNAGAQGYERISEKLGDATDCFGESRAESIQGEATAGVGTPPDTSESIECNTPVCAIPDAAMALDMNDHSGEIDDCELSDGEAATPTAKSPSFKGRQSFGGIYATWDSVASLTREERKYARDILRALRRIIKAFSTGLDGEYSPRYNGKQLARELVGKTGRINRARRRELEVGQIIVACDVSGSCSASAYETVLAAKALTLEYQNIVVVIHSNGYIINITAAGKTTANDLDGNNSIKMWDCLLTDATVMIAFGDYDAVHIYKRILADNKKLIWLDSYAAKAGVREVCRGNFIYEKDIADKITAWYCGVNSAGTAAIALRDAARQIKRVRGK